MRNHKGISYGRIYSVMSYPPATTEKTSLLESTNQFRGLARNYQPWRTIPDSETNLKVGAKEAAAAYHLPRKIPVSFTQPLF